MVLEEISSNLPWKEEERLVFVSPLPAARFSAVTTSFFIVFLRAPCPSVCSRANVFIFPFYKQISSVPSPSSRMSLAPLEKLPPAVVMTQQKVTQQPLPKVSNQSQIAINFYSHAYV